MDVSIVVPAFNEDESLPELCRWIDEVMLKNKFSYEVIIIDDGSKDDTWKVTEEIHAKNNNIKGLRFRRNYGKAAALHSGFEKAEGDVVITMDADLQDSPEEVPELYRMIKEDRLDMVSGWKKKRHDPLSKRLPSKIYNGLVRKVTGIKLHDFNCGLKAYRRELVKSIEVYGDMHRYMPVIAKAAGFRDIGEKVVQHQARKYGVSKFGLGRAKGMFDLLTITFISRFGKKPMQFFGTMGTLMFMVGGIGAAYILFRKWYCLYNDLPVREVADQPLFYLSLVLTIIGSQFFLAGFLGELISRNSSDRNTYLIDKEL